MHPLRTLLKTPWLSGVIVVSLAIGIAANTTVFSWLKEAYFAPLPGVDSSVLLLETKDDTGGYVTTSWLEYRDLRELLPSFAGIAAQRPRAFYLGNSERESRLYGELVSETFFDVLGVRPALGRFFRPEEATIPGSAPVAVISHELWRGYFGGAADILGRTLTLNRRTLTIVGVTPEGFRGGFNSLGFDVFIPLTMAAELQPATSELTRRATRNYVMLARLKPGATLAQARGELAAAAKHMVASYPETNRGLAYELLPLWQSPRGGMMVVTGLITLQVLAALILVVVCANTANLLLARASVRQREIGVRLALGAGPTRIVLQLLAESVLLGLVAAGLGVLLAMWGVELLRQIPLPGSLPVRIAPALDWIGLLFATGLAATCGLAFGLVPAWQLARSDVLHALRGSRGAVGGRSRVRDALVGLEVAVALVVLVLAAMFTKSFSNSLHASPGYDPDRVLLAAVDLAGRGYNADTSRQFVDRLLQRLADMPGVEHAATANQAPIDARGMAVGVISVEGTPFDPERKIHYYNVTPGYFATMGIGIVAGRDLAPLARTDLPLDAVINEEMARRYWPGISPVGRRFELSGVTYEVAGVARTVKYVRLNETPQPAAWLTWRAQFISTPTIHLRAAHGDPNGLAGALRAAVRELDPELALLDPRTLARHIENNLAMQRVPAQMLALLGPLALLLAAIGLYAVLAYAVAQRTAEIGVRLTLGATPHSVVRLVIWQHMKIVLASTVLGWIAALAIGYYIQPWLVGVPPGDPVIYGCVPLLLIVVAAFACWLPARKAAEVDPMAALRAE